MQQKDFVRTRERASVYGKRLERDRPIKRIKELLRHGLSEGSTNARVASAPRCRAVCTSIRCVMELSTDHCAMMQHLLFHLISLQSCEVVTLIGNARQASPWRSEVMKQRKVESRVHQTHRVLQEHCEIVSTPIVFYDGRKSPT